MGESLSPLRICNADPRCPEPAVYRGKCQRHAREQDRQVRRAGHKIYRTRRWKVTRAAFLTENPLCECGELATDVHHIRDLADGGDPWSFENLAGLCKSCHSRITRRRQG